MDGISSIYSALSEGLNLAGDRFNAASRKISELGSGAAGSDNLAANLLSAMADKLTYDANARALKMAHQTLGTVMDVLDTPLRA